VDVSDVLRDRTAAPGGLQGMIAVSLLVHAVLVSAALFLPMSLLSSTPPLRTVMTITLNGGNGGPENGGATPLGGRPVQAEPLPEPPKRPEPVRPPAAKTPEMTVPIPTKTPAKPAKPTLPAPAVKDAPDNARGRTPTRGAETRTGSTVVETGARGQGFGLSSSGGTGSGSTLDVSDFCCPDYIQLMVEKIRSNWNSRAEVTGLAIVKYTIQRDGTISNAEIVKSSGFAALDISAQRAVLATRQLVPLPAAFPNPTLTVNLHFDYIR
jgi:periplasmic protein TonB